MSAGQELRDPVQQLGRCRRVREQLAGEFFGLQVPGPRLRAGPSLVISATRVIAALPIRAPWPRKSSNNEYVILLRLNGRRQRAGLPVRCGLARKGDHPFSEQNGRSARPRSLRRGCRGERLAVVPRPPLSRQATRLGGEPYRAARSSCCRGGCRPTGRAARGSSWRAGPCLPSAPGRRRTARGWPTSVALHELRALHEHAARSARGVEDPAVERLDDLDDQSDDRVRREELATEAALRRGEVGEEVLVDQPERVTR